MKDARDTGDTREYTLNICIYKKYQMSKLTDIRK